MKFANLKNKIGINLIVLLGWVALYYGFIAPHFWGDGSSFILVFFIPLLLIAIGICFCIYLIELLSGYKIKNKFILENKVYNIFFIIGLLVSVFTFIMCLYMFISVIFNR